MAGTGRTHGVALHCQLFLTRDDMPSVTATKTFMHLFCQREQCLTPHWAGRVLSPHGPLVELELHCQRCGTKVRYETDKLPAGYRVYQVRLTGEDNPAELLEFRPQPLPFLEEEFAIVATSSQQAHELADALTSLRFVGHIVQHYVDGEVHLDERF